MRVGRFLFGVAIVGFLSDSNAAQDKEPRVITARANRTDAIRALFAKAGVAYPPAVLYLRGFKHESTLELWAAATREAPLSFIRAYPVCAASGTLGPKRVQGDLQVPEGFYEVDRFNPRSNFHLSLGLNYPNASDRVRSDKRNPGGDVFIHGNCVTIGCLPIEDGPIEELYVIALDARAQGARTIPVHVFPRQMDEPGMLELKKAAGANLTLWEFWQELQPGFVGFEQERKVPRVVVNQGTGRYRVQR